MLPGLGMHVAFGTATEVCGSCRGGQRDVGGEVRPQASSPDLSTPISHNPIHKSEYNFGKGVYCE
jgi:hypothetical protein